MFQFFHQVNKIGKQFTQSFHLGKTKIKAKNEVWIYSFQIEKLLRPSRSQDWSYQTPKLLLVGVATDHDARHACLIVLLMRNPFRAVLVERCFAGTHLSRTTWVRINSQKQHTGWEQKNSKTADTQTSTCADCFSSCFFSFFCFRFHVILNKNEKQKKIKRRRKLKKQNQNKISKIPKNQKSKIAMKKRPPRCDGANFLQEVLPPVCPLLPPQRRAAAGAQQEEHGKPVRLC